MKHFEIIWFGTPENTARERTKVRAPRGGKHVRSEEQAEKMLGRWLGLCQDLAGTVRAAHTPRIVTVLS